MKRLLAWRPFQEIVAVLIWLYVGALARTLRWRIEGWEAASSALRSSQGALVLFWHGELGEAMACIPMLGSKPRRVLISLSRDGEFVAAAARRLGAPPIRGSSGKGHQPWSKRGPAAFREAVQFLKAGGAVLLTPDGPRGPRGSFPAGPIQLARKSAAPVFFLGLAARPAARLRTWDGARIPAPFAKARLVIDGPFYAPESLAATEAEDLRQHWQDRLARAQARAEL
ncbi:MAG TPA: DUF374 domain-containing protein [Caulobacteraceae bacterium]|nr:DUF374 domain-containing protein [Caulobacteraceae bacterium]